MTPPPVIAPAKILKIPNVFLATHITTKTDIEPGREVDRDLTLFTYEKCDAVLAAIADFETDEFLQKFLANYKRLRSLMYALRGSARPARG